ncbi:hypothetical protein FNL37_0658 [Methylovorus glucosotrophus]|uniref:hypothetical protein n=1 Tax=Methylovorus glucosotrophus TaxID=266009 RepID=UPI001331AD18|nr:hypothetical protein [Methylovorus glucosotrophus]KAF0843238.1 hypothetical protein FNL37_0658 [Methylovorus glucosotrophus]
MELKDWQRLHEKWEVEKAILAEYQDTVDQETELVLMGKSRGPTNALRIRLVQQRKLESNLRNELDHFLDGCFDVDVIN